MLLLLKLPTSRWTAVKDCGAESPAPPFFLRRECEELVGEASDADFQISDQGLDTP